ncbi:hypothetical protein Ga0609869_003529 [Rhodovulum iodosum]|uniref:Uncharacterized protein n=1 Tax=Rhodovulum iodosum TaxID=68291 RepID=A0ABV3XXS1_9RHOB|nr:hypothetical protein [Rhodovulum robiginosum]RSK38153.1 hypothetical protein EJA01_02375 [Rhodovulum robiginosum]
MPIAILLISICTGFAATGAAAIFSESSILMLALIYWLGGTAGMTAMVAYLALRPDCSGTAGTPRGDAMAEPS